jgi:3-oxoadipyl-CoA thiolase
LEKTMSEAFICDAIRTPIGRYAGALSSIRADDLAAIPIKALIDRNPNVDWDEVDDVILGCANQAGEDNRNLARMAGLLAGLPDKSGGVTLNRLCGSGMDAVAMAARVVRGREADLMIAGGSESMSRAPFVMAKATSAFDRNAEMYDTTIGWRFVNPKMKGAYGDDTMPSTGENVAQDFNISREDQDAFAVRSQNKAAAAQANGRLAPESSPWASRSARAIRSCRPRRASRATSVEQLGKLKPIVRGDGTVTAAMPRASMTARPLLLSRLKKAPSATASLPLRVWSARAWPGCRPDHGHRSGARVREAAEAPRPHHRDMDVVELNEAFAAQALPVLRRLGLPDDAPHVNPNGGAIALGHPLGMSGARLALTATEELQRTGGRYALCTMCIGVGQGIALVIERV